VRKIHFLIKPTLAAGKRWGYLVENAAEGLEPPTVPAPIPDPPSAKEAAKVLNSAWFLDFAWAVFIWLAMVAGCRRGELVGLRWSAIDFTERIMTVGWSEQQRKDGSRRRKRTKSHQIRRISFDQYTAVILQELKQQAEEQCRSFGVTLRDDAYLFSNEPDFSIPLVPNDVTHRYSRLARKLNLSSTRLHSLRHFTATELLSAGVDLRTVAGRLGHGSGGATTLKVYAAWSPDADAKASSVISRKLPRPGAEPERIETVVNGKVLQCLCGNTANWAMLRIDNDQVNAICAPCGSSVKGLDISEIQQSALVDDRDFEGRPYLRIAAKYRAQIKSNILLPGMQMPSVKKLAAAEGVAPATAHRAMSVLADEGLIVVRRGARAVVALQGEGI
jgi:integrase